MPGRRALAFKGGFERQKVAFGFQKWWVLNPELGFKVQKVASVPKKGVLGPPELGLESQKLSFEPQSSGVEP